MAVSGADGVTATATALLQGGLSRRQPGSSLDCRFAFALPHRRAPPAHSMSPRIVTTVVPRN